MTLLNFCPYHEILIIHEQQIYKARNYVLIVRIQKLMLLINPNEKGLFATKVNMKVDMSTTKLNIYQEICEKFNETE